MKTPNPELDTLIASLFYLMTRYAMNNDPQLIEAITKHLQMVQNHPDANSSILNKTCQRLEKSWGLVADKSITKNSDSEINHSFSDNYNYIH
ncbi:MAG: hypothetical protein AAGB35_09350 [Pseudomonadota bacterium]